MGFPHARARFAGLWPVFVEGDQDQRHDRFAFGDTGGDQQFFSGFGGSIQTLRAFHGLPKAKGVGLEDVF